MAQPVPTLYNIFKAPVAKCDLIQVNFVSYGSTCEKSSTTVINIGIGKVGQIRRWR
jgi:hypothetical protein